MSHFQVKIHLACDLAIQLVVGFLDRVFHHLVPGRLQAVRFLDRGFGFQGFLVLELGEEDVLDVGEGPSSDFNEVVIHDVTVAPPGEIVVDLVCWLHVDVVDSLLEDLREHLFVALLVTSCLG